MQTKMSWLNSFGVRTMRKLVSLAALWAVFVPALAFGQTSVTVLGLRAATAEEGVAAQMTDALRQAAESATSSNLTHTGRENALSQLLIVFDCREPTTACMREIGQSLNSQRLIYGIVEPESGRSDSNYAVTLHFFNVERGVVERDLQEVIPRTMTASQMIEPASQFYSALTGAVVTGELAIRCNVPDARVLVDGEVMGTTSEEPLVLRDLEPGELDVVVEHDDYERYRRTVVIEAGQLFELEATLNEVADDTDDTDDGDDTDVVVAPGGEGPGGEEPGYVEPSGPRSLAWLGWTNIGLAVVFSGLGIWSSASVNAALDDVALEREQWQSDENFCDQAANGIVRHESSDAGEISDICDRAGTMQALQFVFYGLSAVTFGVGLWLVLREHLGARGESADQARRLTVTPVAFQGGGAVSASLTF
jgi:hypothetical protein